MGEQDENLVVLDNALQELARFDSRKAQVVELRFFGGLKVEETAEVLKVSSIAALARCRRLASLCPHVYEIILPRCPFKKAGVLHGRGSIAK